VQVHEPVDPVQSCEHEEHEPQSRVQDRPLQSCEQLEAESQLIPQLRPPQVWMHVPPAAQSTSQFVPLHVTSQRLPAAQVRLEFVPVSETMQWPTQVTSQLTWPHEHEAPAGQVHVPEEHSCSGMHSGGMAEASHVPGLQSSVVQLRYGHPCSSVRTSQRSILTPIADAYPPSASAQKSTHPPGIGGQSSTGSAAVSRAVSAAVSAGVSGDVSDDISSTPDVSTVDESSSVLVL
jgi:hypothetical protein